MRAAGHLRGCHRDDAGDAHAVVTAWLVVTVQSGGGPAANVYTMAPPEFAGARL